MRASIQNQISPPTPQSGLTFNEKGIANTNSTVKDSNEKSKLDFRTIMLNSNESEARSKLEKDSKDLSTAKTDDEFFDRLNQQTTKKRVPKNNLDKDDFLKLFVEQLKHQDPLNPDDGAEMAAKLAQFNGLEQMMNVNKTLDKLLAAEKFSQNSGLVNYIGKEVTLEGGKLHLDKGKATGAIISIGSDAASSTVEVRDRSGHLVWERSLGPLTKGDHPINWHGKDKDGKPLPSGEYNYSVSARDGNENPIPVQIQTEAIVKGVDISASDPTFFTSVGRINGSDIKSVGTLASPKGESLKTDAKASSIQSPKIPQEISENSKAKPQMPTDEQLQKIAAQKNLEKPKSPNPEEIKADEPSVEVNVDAADNSKKKTKKSSKASKDKSKVAAGSLPEKPANAEKA